MKNKLVVAILTILLLVMVVLIMTFPGGDGHEPRDLSYWIQAGGAKDWSAEAAQGQAQAQFYYGLGLIRSNVVIMTDRIPTLSDPITNQAPK